MNVAVSFGSSAATRLGINEEQIYNQLQARNVAADGGRIRVGDQHIAIDPTGGFGSAEEMLELVIGSDSTGRQLFLKDVATIDRNYEDPPRRLLRYDKDTAGGLMTPEPIILLGISTVAEALARIREEDVPAAIAATVFVVDPPTQPPTGIYRGAASFQRLLREAPGLQLGEIVDGRPEPIPPDLPILPRSLLRPAMAKSGPARADPLCPR